MTAFCDLEHDLRFQLRDVIEATGGEVEGYQGDSVQVALPNHVTLSTFISVMAISGMKYVPESCFLFPLGSDNPPMILRHDGRYQGSKGFWKYARFDYCPQT